MIRRKSSALRTRQKKRVSHGGKSLGPESREENRKSIVEQYPKNFEPVKPRPHTHTFESEALRERGEEYKDKRNSAIEKERGSYENDVVI